MLKRHKIQLSLQRDQIQKWTENKIDRSMEDGARKFKRFFVLNEDQRSL